MKRFLFAVLFICLLTISQAEAGPPGGFYAGEWCIQPPLPEFEPCIRFQQSETEFWHSWWEYLYNGFAVGAMIGYPSEDGKVRLATSYYFVQGIGPYSYLDYTLRSGVLEIVDEQTLRGTLYGYWYSSVQYLYFEESEDFSSTIQEVTFRGNQLHPMASTRTPAH